MTAAAKVRPAADPWVPLPKGDGFWRRLSDGSIGALVAADGRWCLVRFNGTEVIPEGRDWKRAADVETAKHAADVALGLADPSLREQAREAVVQIVGVTALFFVGWGVWSFALSRLWNDNLAPLGLPSVTAWQTAGLWLLFGASRLAVHQPTKDFTPEPLSTSVSVAVTKWGLLLALVSLSSWVTA